MTEIDRTLIGTEMPAFEVEVERGAIRKFARAIGDDNPLFLDVAFARAKGYADLLAPPTFPTTFRTPRQAPWLEALDWRRIVAGGVAFTYRRPLVAGMSLVCRFTLVDVEEKRSSKGAMELMKQDLRAEDDAGALIVILSRTTIYRSLDHVEKASLA